MSQQFYRDGRWLTLEQMKEYNNAKIKPKTVQKVEEEIVHEVTEDEVLEEVLEGEKAEFFEPSVEEVVIPKAKKTNKK